MTSPADTIREALDDFTTGAAHRDALAALTELEQQLENARLELVDRSRLPITTRRLIERAEAAEADRDRMERQFNVELDRALAAEADRDRLADTLREIASGQTVLATPGVLDNSFSGRTAQEYKRLARAALDRHGKAEP